MDDPAKPIEDKLRKVRLVIKTHGAVESLTIPILSVLKLQLDRGSYLRQTWIDPQVDLNPLEFGWTLDDESKYQVSLQDPHDIFYSLPKDFLHGCSCKRDCQTGRCSCNRVKIFSLAWGHNCSRWTCKCTCFSNIDEEEDMTVEEEPEVFDDSSSAEDSDIDIDLFDTLDSEDENE